MKIIIFQHPEVLNILKETGVYYRKPEHYVNKTPEHNLKIKWGEDYERLGGHWPIWVYADPSIEAHRVTWNNTCMWMQSMGMGSDKLIENGYLMLEFDIPVDDLHWTNTSDCHSYSCIVKELRYENLVAVYKTGLSVFENNQCFSIHRILLVDGKESSFAKDVDFYLQVGDGTLIHDKSKVIDVDNWAHNPDAQYLDTSKYPSWFIDYFKKFMGEAPPWRKEFNSYLIKKIITAGLKSGLSEDAIMNKLNDDWEVNLPEDFDLSAVVKECIV